MERINKSMRKISIVGKGVGLGVKAVVNKSRNTITKTFSSNTEEEKDVLDLFAEDLFKINDVISLDDVKESYCRTLAKDDNRVIVENILERLQKGATEYKHGMRVSDNTRMYGTKDNSWLEMALEEYLDGILYITSSLIRFKRRMKLNNYVNKSERLVYDDSIIHETKQIIYDKYFQQKDVLQNL